MDNMSLDLVPENWKQLTYVDELPEDIGPFRKLLEDYSKVPPNKVDEHLLNAVGIFHALFPNA